MDNHVSFCNIVFGLASARPTPQGLSGAPKMLGKKIIYVESFAKLNNKSVTGEMVYPFADYFFVQWKEMKRVYPKAIYHGTVY